MRPQVRPWSEIIPGHSHVFCIQLKRGGPAVAGSTKTLSGADESAEGVEMLLLSADTPRDK